MHYKRVIPCMDVDAGRVVKGTRFIDIRDAGDPVELAARYDAEGYEGSAAVLYVDEGKLFWVSGSHCSCNGLEDHWDPTETSIDTLRHVAQNGYGTEKDVAETTLQIIEKLGLPDDPDAIVAAVALYFGGRS